MLATFIPAHTSSEFSSCEKREERWKHLQWLLMTALILIPSCSAEKLLSTFSSVGGHSWASRPLVGCTVWWTVQLYVRFIPFWKSKTWQCHHIRVYVLAAWFHTCSSPGKSIRLAPTAFCGKQQGLLSQCAMQELWTWYEGNQEFCLHRSAS